ncbi:hypothetical protein [Pseudanabaena sp. ABRG5-3]|nr:hypothetical protein [Pseudanabaena sp. ABRG5-3]
MHLVTKLKNIKDYSQQVEEYFVLSAIAPTLDDPNGSTFSK